TFFDGDTVLGTGTLYNGYDSATNSYVSQASISLSNPSIGSHSITAVYSGDANSIGSGSDPVSIAVRIGETTTTVATSVPAVFAGQGTSFTATVKSTGVTPTGSVTFYDGDTVLGTCSLYSYYDYTTYSYVSQASISGLNSWTGAHSVTAVYSGDPNNNPSTSGPTASSLVSMSETTTTLATATPSIFAGQSVLVMATITSTGVSPGGTVTFVDGTTILGVASVYYSGYDSGTGQSLYQASLYASGLGVGSHSITAVYNGDTRTKGSVSDPVTETVNIGESTTTLATSTPTIFAGQSYQVTAFVTSTGVSPTGYVTFLDGNTVLGVSTLTGYYDYATYQYVYQASVSVSNPSIGSHSITAVYSGDANSTGSTSDPVTETVNVGESTTTLATSTPTIFAGQSFQLTARVSATGVSPTGYVTFLDGNTVLGVSTLAGYYDSATYQYVHQASFSVSGLSVGGHSITAVYSGDANHTGSTSDPVSETVNIGESTVSLWTSASSTTLGQSFQLTATVSATGVSPTGAVTFLDGSTVVGVSTLAGYYDYATYQYVHQASISVSNLGVGSHSITAVYSGDHNHDGSTSNAVSASVTATGSSVGTWNSPSSSVTTTSLTTSAASIYAGQGVSLTANVSGAGVTPGTVTFMEGNTVLGVSGVGSYYNSYTGTYTNQAGIYLSNLSVGSHSITAVYSGDANNNTSTSNAVTETVNIATTTTSLTTSTASIYAGQGTSFTATVSGPGVTPSGVVTFKDGSTVLGVASLYQSYNSYTGTYTCQANLYLSNWDLGSHSITAVYSGDANNSASTSNTVAETVSIATTSTSLTTSVASIFAGQGTTLTATVTGPGVFPTGVVKFMAGNTVLGTSSLYQSYDGQSGTYTSQASLYLSGLSLGGHTITAVYSGDAYNSASTSNTVTETVNIGVSAIDLTTSSASLFVKQGATLTAKVSSTGLFPTGVVKFMDGNTVLGTSSLYQSYNWQTGTYTSQASLYLTGLSLGDHSITAVYSGDAYTASSSASLIESVAPTPTLLTLNAPNAATSAQAVNVSVTITPTYPGLMPTGTVTFMDGSNVLATVAVFGFTAYLPTTAPWSLGTHTITATYSGDSGNDPSSTDAVSLTVSPQTYQTTYQLPLVVSAANGLWQSDPDDLGTDNLSTPTVASGPSNGTLEVFEDGSFIYTPNDGFVGTDTFTFQLSGSGGTGTVNIVVTDTVPVITSQTYTLLANRPFTTYAANGPTWDTLTGGVLAGAIGSSGAILTAQLVSGPAHGTLDLDANGNFSYEPDDGFVGTDSFTFSATDGALTSAPAVVTLHVADTAPVGQNRTYTTLPDQLFDAVENGVLAGASDRDGDPLMAFLVNGPTHGTLALSPEGSFSYIPNLGFLGTDSFTFQISDGTLTSSTYTATIEVAALAPTAIGMSYSVVHDQLLGLSPEEGLLSLATFSDLNAVPAFSLASGPANGSVTVYANGAFIYTPDAGFVGTDSFTYQVSDGYLNSAPATITIDVTDAAPVAYFGWYAATENQPLLVLPGNDVLATAFDADGDSITASLVTGPGHGTLSFHADGSFIYTPATDFVGTDSFTFRPFDGVRYGQTTKVIITVDADPTNKPPQTAADSYTVLHDNTITVNAGQGTLANDSDPSGRPLTAQLLSGPAYGTVVLNTLGSFQYIPNAGFVGTDTFTYKAYNGKSYSDATTVAITVTDQTPTAVPVSYSIVHDRTLIVPLSQGVLAGAADADADPLSAILVDSPANGTVLLNFDGSFTYVPDPGFVGIDSFSFAVSDGAVSGTPTTVTISVTDVVPTASPSIYTVGHDHVLTVGAWNGVLTGAIDVDTDPITAVLLSGPSHGSLTLNSNGSFQYTPNASYVGPDSFTFAPSDGPLSGDPVTVAITVTNPAPVAQNARFLYEPGATLTVGTWGGLLNYGYDPLGYALAVSLVSGPAHGTLSLNANGTFTYTPDAGYTGDDSFAYVLVSAYGTSPTAVVTLQALATAANPLTISQPTVVAHEYTLNHDTLFSTVATGGGVLGGASDPQGFPLSAILVSTVSHGDLIFLADGEFIYRPYAGYSGTDQFTFRASNGQATSNATTVTLTVVETAPTAQESSFTVAANQALFVGVANGVLNGATDAQNDYLSAVLVSGPSHGALTLFPDGSFGYTPTAGYVGLDSFTFRADDGTLTSATKTVSIAVTDPPPVVTNPTYSVMHDTLLIVSAAPTGAAGSIPVLPGLPGSGGSGLLAGVSNPSGNPLTAVLVDGPSNGTLVFSANGSFRYTAATGYIGTDSFTYYVTDGTVASAVATATILVTNQAPTATTLTYSVLHDQTLLVGATKGLRSGVADADQDPLTLAVLTQPTNGTLAWNADGSFQYTPNAHFAGTETLTYAVSDGALTSGPVTVTINVTNNAPTVTSQTFSITHDTLYLASMTRGLLSFATDADNDPLTLTVLGAPDNGTLTYFDNGAFRYTPNAGFVGTDSISFRVSDGVTDSAVGTVTFNVVNSAPVAKDLTYSVNHDQQLVVPATAAGNLDPASVASMVTQGALAALMGVSASLKQGLVANGSDADGDLITVNVGSEPTHGTVVWFPDGAFYYIPDEHFVGTDTFEYFLSDGISTSEFQTVTINVVNTAPSVPTKTFEVNRGSILSVTDPNQGVLAPPARDAEHDSVTATLVTGPTHGTLVFKPDGSFLYTPNTGYVGSDTFTFTVSDGLASVTVTDTINVVEVPPKVSAVTYNYTVGLPLVIDATGTHNGVLGSVVTSNGDTVVASLVSGPSNGTVSLSSNGSFTYTPNGSSTTPDSFRFRVFDGYAYSDIITVTLTPILERPGEHFTSDHTRAQAVLTTAKTDAAETLKGATLTANIAQLGSAFTALSAFNLYSQGQNAVAADVLRTQTDALAIKQLQSQAVHDTNRAAAAAVLNQALLNNASQRWESEATADQANFDTTRTAVQTLSSGVIAAAVADLNARAAADAALAAALNAAWAVQLAANATIEDAYNTAANDAQAAYQDAQTQAVTTYQGAVADAAVAEASALHTAETAYHNAVVAATNSMRTAQDDAHDTFQQLIAGAQADLTATLQAAQTAYDQAVAAAAVSYGMPQPGDPVAPDVTEDPDYLAAVTAARADYANAVAAAKGLYQLAFNAASLVRSNAMAAAQTAFNQAEVTARSIEQTAIVVAQTTYLNTLVASQVTHDQSIAAAKATLNATVAAAKTVANAGLQAANQVYDDAVANDQSTFQNSVDAAQATYQSTVTGLASTYASALATANATYNSSLKANQATYDAAAAAALATQNVAIQAAQTQYQTQVKTVVQAQERIQQQAQQTYNAIKAQETGAYNEAKEKALAEYQSAVNKAQSVFESATRGARWAYRGAMAAASARWVASYGWAQTRFTRSLFTWGAPAAAGNETAITNLQEARKNLAIRQAEADLSYQQRAGAAAVTLMQAQQGPANVQAQTLAAAIPVQVAAMQAAETENTAAMAPAAQALKVAIEAAAVRIGTGVATAGEISNKSVDAATRIYSNTLTAAAQVQSAADGVALVALNQAISAASTAYTAGQNTAMQTATAALNAATATLNAATAAEYATWV
ncbi:MAG: hypothetical protein C0467_31095, partial [Planctomycetaceae bacterium]|nr:hypothetical protein [Planctomycetaceae bacterium]